MASQVGRLGAQPILLQQVLSDPYEVAEHLVSTGAVYGLVNVDVRHQSLDLVIFWLTLEPWAPMEVRGYPTEHVSISVWRSGRIVAVPVNRRARSWLHIYPAWLGSLEALGQLCLWYPDDPRSLRWEWEDGLVKYITIVHRHLQAEEYYRRNGTWPAEDAPHGTGPSGQGPHPIATPALRTHAQEAA